MRDILCLSQNDILVSGATDIDLAVHLIETTLQLALNDDAFIAAESALRCFSGDSDEAIYSLPAYIGGVQPIAGLKWTAHGPASNSAKRLPHICALIVLNDVETGVPLAIMDGGIISSVRTAAATAVALKYLAPLKTERIVLCGTGAQARQQLRAIAFCFPKVCIDIWGRTPEHAIRLAERAQNELCLDAHPVEELQLATSVADIIVSATSATEPYLTVQHFKEDCLYCHIGLNDITADAINAFDTVVVDAWEEAKHCSAQSLFRAYREGTFTERSLTGLLGEYAVGQKCVALGKRRVFFDAFGLAIFDLALARHAWFYANARGLGKKVPIWYDDYGLDL